MYAICRRLSTAYLCGANPQGGLKNPPNCSRRRQSAHFASAREISADCRRRLRFLESTLAKPPGLTPMRPRGAWGPETDAGTTVGLDLRRALCYLGGPGAEKWGRQLHCRSALGALWAGNCRPVNGCSEWRSSRWGGADDYGEAQRSRKNCSALLSGIGCGDTAPGTSVQGPRTVGACWRIPYVHWRIKLGATTV